MEVLKNSLGQSHDIIGSVVGEGDIVVDATAGNGNDTVFLAGLVGNTGKVYSFDIQENALRLTESKLVSQSMADRVVLVKDSHHNLDKYVGEQISAVMFNLGYLPGGNHSIGTKGETTRIAIEKAMERLKINGIISVVIYYGGDSGYNEKEHIIEYIKTIDSKRFTVMQTEFVNQSNCPPIMVCIERIK